MDEGTRWYPRKSIESRGSFQIHVSWRISIFDIYPHLNLMVNPKLMVVESHWNPNHSADYHLIISALSHHHVTIMPPWNQHSSFHISIHFIYPYIKHGLLENPPFFMNIFEEATLKWCFFPWLVWQNHSECGKPNFSKTIPKASPFLWVLCLPY